MNHDNILAHLNVCFDFIAPYYILPSIQTVTANSNESTPVMLSVWVKNDEPTLNNVYLIDGITGNALNATVVGTPSYTQNSVNTYKVIIPSTTSLQNVQAFSNTCSTLNNCTNNNYVVLYLEYLD